MISSLAIFTEELKAWVYLYTHVHSSTVHDSQKEEATRLSVSREKDK
jgi:hypothetical protein